MFFALVNVAAELDFRLCGRDRKMMKCAAPGPRQCVDHLKLSELDASCALVDTWMEDVWRAIQSRMARAEFP